MLNLLSICSCHCFKMFLGASIRTRSSLPDAINPLSISPASMVFPNPTSSQSIHLGGHRDMTVLAT
ncbi:hypothetical protein DSECCO2_548380 [anaerobic digester metagenome]